MSPIPVAKVATSVGAAALNGFRTDIGLAPIHKWLNCPLSVSRGKFNPRNIKQMPAVKFCARLDLEPIRLFTPMLHKKDGNKLTNRDVRRLKVESKPDCYNKPTMHSGIGSIFHHLFYPSGKPEDSRSGLAEGLRQLTTAAPPAPWL